MERHLIEKAYLCAKETFKKNNFSFKDLYEVLLKEEPSIKDEATDLYIEILQDIRFISLGKQKWALRENFTLAQINKITSSMFGLDEYHEEDADQYMSEAEKIELKSKNKENEELLLDDENLDDDDNFVKPNLRKLGDEPDETIDDLYEKPTSSTVINNDDIEDDEDLDEDDSIIPMDDEEENNSNDDEDDYDDSTDIE